MKTFLKILVVILLINLGFGALYGGWMLISDPTGIKFEWTVELLAGTPFKNFLIPGIILTLMNGILPLIITVLALIKAKNHEWLIIIQGCILIGWLTIEILLNSDLFEPVLRYPCYITGILLVAIGVIFLKKKRSIIKK